MNQDKLKGHAAMIAANIAWGLMAPLSKLAMGNPAINPWMLVSFRVIGAAVAFWIASLFVKRERVPLADLKLLAIAALLGIILNQGVFIFGVSLTSPINASIVTTTLPIVTMIIAAIYLKEPITWTKFTGIVVGASGALLLILSSTAAGGAVNATQSLMGIGLCLFSQVSYASYFVLFKNSVSKYHPITQMKWMFLFAAMIYLPFNFNQLTATDFSAVPTSILGDIAFVVFGATFFSYLMIPIGQKFLRPTVATMYNNVQPVVASFAAVFWQLDTFGWRKGLAIVLVFVGVYIVTQSKARDNSAETEDNSELKPELSPVRNRKA
ncbi:DMT family transporter [Mangrovibacterium diazotrophicum]|uniref:Drug/metabolite transporter (DMT)-like permease n=1 Tax=Mangrovibacterium diazotrophicum TaxID=1261403 RepID=A0A419W9A9_9BACT|nr:DMT family transporter [Mangrovibacterium diazotrophicum]RKD92058.1 drug/metabolite transporter (DMT)-like permease [Mangrovibacterium diazotrophicum]